MARIDAALARTWVRLYTGALDQLSRRACEGFYDGDRADAYARDHGSVPVVLVIPAMSDVNGALPHPGVAVLQAILRHQGVPCEVVNYNLPINHPRDPFDHLIRLLRSWGTRVLGVSTYSQSIRQTLQGLQTVRQALPDLTIVLGGPHPTEAYLSLLGVRFIDYLCRGEAEESFPRLVHAILNGTPPAGIPGVYRYDRAAGRVEGVSAPFIALDQHDKDNLLRYQFSPEELRHQRRYRGCHGSAGAEYWPIALVRGCPYDCTYCAAYQMSGKKLRYRQVSAVVEDMVFYRDNYGRRQFSFIDDAFTQRYEYVVDLCRELLDRKLDVTWTTDNGIRSETLGGGKFVAGALRDRSLQDVDELLTLMIRAGWRGTAIGIESGSIRVRRELVRKGGANLSNEDILENLVNLKRIAAREGVYFYVNGFMMAGFPDLPLPNGTVIPGETEEEREMTRAFALQLRDSGAVDMVSLNMLIPLPGTDMWDALAIDQKLAVLLGVFPADHPEAREVARIRNVILDRFGDNLAATRYAVAAEATFWRLVYELSDEAQILVMQSYDAFNIDASHDIRLERPAPEVLSRYREEVVDAFYGSAGMKRRMLRHVFHRSENVLDVASYVTLLSRKYDPATKARTRQAAG